MKWEVVGIRDNIKGGALTETTFLVLLALYKPNHGYGVMQFVARKTNGRVLLGAGTLYGAINTLLKRGWIESVDNGGDSAKKEYIITQLGAQISMGERKRLGDVLHLASSILDE
jgi:DNA-binding PadR family transcriptional regulator